MEQITSARQTLYNMLWVIEEELRIAKHEYHVSRQIFVEKNKEYNDIKFLLEKLDGDLKVR